MISYGKTWYEFAEETNTFDFSIFISFTAKSKNKYFYYNNMLVLLEWREGAHKKLQNHWRLTYCQGESYFNLMFKLRWWIQAT